MLFHGRIKELRVLTDAWNSDRSGMIPVYGRRRVGKSELILHFVADKPSIYFVGKRAPGAAQVREFLQTAARELEEPLLAKLSDPTWKTALELVVERTPKHRKIIIALDEYQWIAESSPEISSVLQELWDRKWSKSGRILLLLCGSYLGFMEREVLGSRSPLFGRRTAQILLQPFGYREAAAFHPHFSVVDHARTYAICGGIPAYLLAFEDRLSIEQNIAKQLLDDNAVLAREPEFLLREELRDLVTYHAVLMALAEGKSTPALLSQRTGIDARAIPYYLSTLCELGYVQRKYPLTHEKPSAKSIRYMLEDPLLRFWFRFVFPNQSIIRLLGPEKAFREMVRPEFDAYLGYSFERLCRESLAFLYAKENMNASFIIGEYWTKEVQIDVVSLRKDHWVDLGECKWANVRSMKSLVQQLDQKVHLFPNRQNATIGRHIFVRNFTQSAKSIDPSIRVHTLQSLYRL